MVRVVKKKERPVAYAPVQFPTGESLWRFVCIRIIFKMVRDINRRNDPLHFVRGAVPYRQIF